MTQHLSILCSIVSLVCFQQISGQSLSPVVGILTQPRGETTNTTYPEEYVIAASYVKWLESGGARSIPIPYDAPVEMVEDIFGQINGVLLPGGASTVPSSARYLLARAMQESFPVWGTCLGFEYMVEILSNASDAPMILKDGFEAENISLPLENVQARQLYADPRYSEMVTKESVTMNNHRKGVEPLDFESNANLHKLFEITSVNHDRRGRPFVSTIEPRVPRALPFYGVQYHPEKNAFEYGTFEDTNKPYEAISHSDEAVEFSNHLARFFVRLTRKQLQSHNQHAYTKPQVYPLVQTYQMKRGLGFEEYYVIPPAGALLKEET